ncbi:hypothetical protein Dda_1174 [Drechslerella dactyloides]|uniref:Uncharacterized protein n=1 Tax=Drechslerella dactyloides TaxID=74499 RepID=A0AAD6J5U8_DREDA|nr:hypothetical protein Dda_1174 [Drechslerella dactyloides]
MRIFGVSIDCLGLVALIAFLTCIDGVHGLRVAIAWSPYWRRYVNEQYYTLRRTAQWIDRFKETVFEDLPLGLRGEPLLTRRHSQYSLTYLIDTMHVALDQFDNILVELRERAMPPCPMDDQIFVEETLDRWECSTLDDMENISSYLALVVSTMTQARDYLIGVRRSSIQLIGLQSPDIIGGPAIQNSDDRHIVALSVTLANGRLSMRTRRISFDTDGVDKFFQRWSEVYQRLETELEFIEVAYMDAVNFLQSPEWAQLIREWNPDPEGRMAWEIPNVLGQMIYWFEGWMRPLEGILRNVARLGPLPSGPPHWQLRNTDEVYGLYPPADSQGQ